MELRVYLKVCEGCGCLWYRAQEEARVYCSSCYERFKDFPTTVRRKRRGRPRKTVLPSVFAVEDAYQQIVNTERKDTDAGLGAPGLLFETWPLEDRKLQPFTLRIPASASLAAGAQ